MKLKLFFFIIIINSTSIFFHFISFLFHFFLNSILKKISYNHLRPSRLDHIELILIQFNFKSNFNKEQGLKGFFFLSISSFSSQFHPQIFFLLVSHITFRLTKLIGSWQSNFHMVYFLNSGQTNELVRVFCVIFIFFSQFYP